MVPACWGLPVPTSPTPLLDPAVVVASLPPHPYPPRAPVVPTLAPPTSPRPRTPSQLRRHTPPHLQHLPAPPTGHHAHPPPTKPLLSLLRPTPNTTATCIALTTASKTSLFLIQVLLRRVTEVDQGRVECKKPTHSFHSRQGT